MQGSSLSGAMGDGALPGGPVRRGRGRPKGSVKKNSAEDGGNLTSTKRPVGRPRKDAHLAGPSAARPSRPRKNARSQTAALAASGVRILTFISP